MLPITIYYHLCLIYVHCTLYIVQYSNNNTYMYILVIETNNSKMLYIL